jgi:hypothetical protein
MFEQYDYARCIASEGDLHKLDFWLRYPDHLAAALLRECEPGQLLTHRAGEVKDVVRRIFADDEPLLRWTPMLRYRYGAYETLDQVMGYLSSRLLAYRRITHKGSTIQYFLTEKGLQAVEEMLRQCPEAHWYAQRCRLIKSFFGELSGTGKRKIQYLEPAYASTPWLHPIARIDAEVRERFQSIFGEPL